MAIDDTLLASVQAGGAPVLRFYQWSPACLSFGRNQVTRDLYEPSRPAALGVDVVRRPTGGLAVLHDRELTYSVAVPAALLGGPRATYRLINEALVRGLRALGVAAETERAAETAGAADAPRPDSVNPCFQAASSGEIMVAGGKLVGSAQRCERRTILQHGSILLDGDQADVGAFQTGTKVYATSGVTLRGILGTVPELSDLVRIFGAGLEATLGTRLAHSTLTGAERLRAESREVHYDSDAWTWRR